MHRSEKRYRKLILTLAVILLIMLPASLVRITLAASQISARTFTERTGRSSVIEDRKGGVLSGGETDFDSVVGNLTGNGWSADNTIARRYAGRLKPSGFNALTGQAGLTDRSWKSLETTLLPIQDQVTLKEAFQGKRGCLFSYNYRTGEVYTLLSLPSASFLAPGEEKADDGRLLNRCLDASYISGSTMKVVTTICALEQDPALAESVFDCTGRLETEGGMDVTCLGDKEGGHGTHDLVGALGVSCNVYFAQLIRTLNVDAAAQTLRQLGFKVNGVSGSFLDVLDGLGDGVLDFLYFIGSGVSNVGSDFFYVFDRLSNSVFDFLNFVGCGSRNSSFKCVTGEDDVFVSRKRRNEHHGQQDQDG